MLYSQILNNCYDSPPDKIGWTWDPAGLLEVLSEVLEVGANYLPGFPWICCPVLRYWPENVYCAIQMLRPGTPLIRHINDKVILFVSAW